MMSSTNNRKAIELKGISVKYRVPTENIGTLKEHVIRLVRGQRVKNRELLALNDLDLEIRQGQSFGIIGSNGAGKSTLLKVISRIIRPTNGRVIVRGKVAPLIELGAGFQPELTGRENVYLNGSILGFSKTEMDERFENIVNFAELWDFIDAPLRTYSSGMIMRLGFSVATNVDPDVLIIDEILAVGDPTFQEKCIDRMYSFRNQNTTILFVSHDLGSVSKLCNECIWLESGIIQSSGNVEKVVNGFRTNQLKIK